MSGNSFGGEKAEREAHLRPIVAVNRETNERSGVGDSLLPEDNRDDARNTSNKGRGDGGTTGPTTVAFLRRSDNEMVEEGVSISDNEGEMMTNLEGGAAHSSEAPETPRESCGVIFHPMRGVWKRSVAGEEEVAAEVDNTEQTAVREQAGGRQSPPESATTTTPSRRRHEFEENEDFVLEPGAYRMYAGRDPQRATSGVLSEFTEMSDERQLSGPAQDRGRAMATVGDNDAFLVEASLVEEEESELRPAPILVEARLVQRRHQLAVIVLVALTVVVMLVGLSVGLTVNRPESTPGSQTDPPTDAPTTSPTSHLDALFRPTLPAYALESLENASSPQSIAYKWIMDEDQIHRSIADESLRLERMKQRFALATLFYATGGESNWQNSSGWLNSTTNECYWYGCCCGANCTIYDADHGSGDDPLDELDLYTNGLVRNVPREIGLLSSLASLHLDSNDLTGSIPSTIGALTNLLSLTLSANLFTSLPSTIGLLTSLVGLSLSNNFLESFPHELGQLTSLQGLSLSYNSCSGTILTELGQLSALSLLDLSCGSGRINGCNSPSDSGFTGPIPTILGKLSLLTYLDLSNNQLSSLPTELGFLTNMLDIHLSSNLLAGPIHTELGKLTAVTSLSLRYNQLNGTIPTELGLLIKAESIMMDYNRLTGSIPTELGKLSFLSELPLTGNRITSTIPTQLGLLTLLGDVSLTGNELTGSIPTEIGQLSDLTSLHLAFNRLNATIPTQLGRLTWLESIDLADNQLTGVVPTALSRLSALTALSLASNHLESTIPTELGLLSRLGTFLVGRNQLTGSVPTDLCETKLALEQSDYYSGLGIVVDCLAVACECNCTCSEAAGDDRYSGADVDDQGH
jgi:Leucine-rich repeat (LRR) protein